MFLSSQTRGVTRYNETTKVQSFGATVNMTCSPQFLVPDHVDFNLFSLSDHENIYQNEIASTTAGGPLCMPPLIFKQRGSSPLLSIKA